MRLGFVGTGFIGSRLASRPLEAGHELFIYDVRREATTKLCELGAQWADSPAAVAEACEGVLPRCATHTKLSRSSGSRREGCSQGCNLAAPSST